MKKSIAVSLLIFVLCPPLFAQKNIVLSSPCVEHEFPDFFIMVNGKLPFDTRTIIRFQPNIFPDSIKYDFYYNVKWFSIEDSILKNISKIIPDTAKIFVEYQFEEAVDWLEYKSHRYFDTIPWSTFLLTRIVLINDMHLKDKNYYIHYELEPPASLAVEYKKKYGNRKRFYNKIFRGTYPFSYTMPSNGKRKSYPNYR